MSTAKRSLIWIISFGFVIACKPQATKLLAIALRNGALQEKDVNGTEITVAYMPSCWQHMSNPQQHVETDTAEMVFRVSIHPRYDAKPLPDKGKEVYSYGVDSLFMLVTAMDTIPALYAHKVANGNIGGIEYLVGFDRSRVKQAPELEFIFRDWLFSSTLLHFGYKRSILEKIDSLSCSI